MRTARLSSLLRWAAPVAALGLALTAGTARAEVGVDEAPSPGPGVGEEAAPAAAAPPAASVVEPDEGPPPSEEAPEEDEAGEGGASGGGPAGGEDAEEAGAARTYGHHFQGGIGVLVGTGYFFELPYANRSCTQVEDGVPTAGTNCQGMSPLFIDFQGSFGVTDGLEVLVEFRLGLLEQYLQNAPNTDEGRITDQDPTRPMAFGVGVRYYTDPLGMFKFFVGALVDIDFTPSVDVDVTVRPMVGFQVDFIRWVGVFLQVSPTISFIRSLRFAFDGGGGLQFRFP